ncbi:MAG: hypothetical protein RLZ98_2035 [Pseudomonadota bacterium]
MSEFGCTQQMLQLARKRLSKVAWDYVNGAAGSETTLRRNRYALDSWAFLPRVLRDVSHIDASTTVLGHKIRMPVLLAPMGSMQLINPEGAKGASKAAGQFGVGHILSSVARNSVEEVAEVNPGLKIYQLYIRGGMDWIKPKLDAAKKAGYHALVMTVDSAHYGIRDRQTLNAFARPSSEMQGEDREFQAAMTWEKMAEVKNYWGRPMILKGIATAADAKIAVEHNIDVVYISNHGGRELDHGRGTLDVLPEVVEAVGNKAEVWIDGGFVRGTDVVKALCLGAKAVGMARLQAWALGANGSEGVARALEIVEEEIGNTMGLLGVNRPEELGPEYLTRVQPMGPWHEHNMFRHIGNDPLI